MPEANSNTTDIQPHQTLHIQSGPEHTSTPIVNDAPAPAAPENDHDESQREPSPRDAAMADIYARRNAQIEKELGINAEISAGSPPNPNDEPAPQVDPAPAAPVHAPAQQPAAQQQPQGLPEQVPVNIGGQVVSIPRDDFLRLAQTGLQAQNVYNEAAQMREQAQRMIGAGQQAPQQHQPAPQAQQAPQPHQRQSAGIEDGVARDIARRMNYGTEEEQARAISDIGAIIQQSVAQAAPANPQLNPQELVNRVAGQVMNTMQQHTNLTAISQEFKEIFEHSELSYAAGYQANMIAQNDARMGRQRPQMEIFREALTGIRDKYLKPGVAGQQAPNSPQSSAAPAAANTSTPAQAASPVAQQMSHRIERKRAAPQPPVAANVRSKGEPEKKFPSNSEIVSSMRKARGQSAF